MTSVAPVALGAGANVVLEFGPFTDGDYCSSLTPVIATPSGDFTLEIKAFNTQKEVAGFEGGYSITRSPVTFPAGLAGIDGMLPVGYRFRAGSAWLGIRITAGATGVGLSVWPTINRSAK